MKASSAQEVGASTQFSTTGVGKPIRLYRIGANGGFYTGMQECRGVPQ